MSVYFKGYDDFQKVFDALMNELISHPLIGPKLARSKMIIQFQYTDPDAQITANFKDPAKDPKLAGDFVWGQTEWQPDVVFKQSADFSNRFWQGKENVIAALAKRQVTAKGSIPKALALIPIIRPAFRLYPTMLERIGRADLVVKE